MKKSIKRSLIMFSIICGFIYVFENISLEAKNIKEVNLNIKKELVLVNKEYGITKNYKPEKLTIPNIKFNSDSLNEEKHVDDKIVKPLENMFSDAANEGIILLGNSGYRSYNSQRKTYSSRVRLEGEKKANAYVAKPGYSEHQTGLCIDITNKEKYFVKGTKEADWLAKNCYKYGFIIRYPEGKEEITGIAYEPWHIRYVGKKVAKEIYHKNITLEEYIEEN